MRKWRRLVNHGRRASKNEERNKKKQKNEKQIRKRRRLEKHKRRAVPKLLKMAVFGCKKMGLGMPKSKNGDHFLSPTIPKNGGIDSCFTRISFSGEFWANFENRVF